ncbi:MAG: hypothetical protein ACRENL_05390 [Candidatus Dormibacteria bacterium]
MTGSAVPDPADPLHRRLRHHYLHSFQDPRRERMFLSSLGFDLGAISARAITHLIRRGIGPFHNLSADGRHLHHLVFGIAGLLGTGYLWLLIADTASEQRPIHRGTAFAYGVGSALTLDEFALWLDLEDVYWKQQGRVSVQALMIFGGLLSAGVWGGAFLKTAARELSRS